MAIVQYFWRCDHVCPGNICWQCTADIAFSRLDRLRRHMEFIEKGAGGITPRQVAEVALAEDARFDDCARGQHTFLDATTYSGPHPQYLPCVYCGAKPAKPGTERVEEPTTV